MTKIVLATEMGGGWGHLLPLQSIAREFLHSGCRILILCSDVQKARAVFSDPNIAIERSPAWNIRKTGFSLNYAQCIWGNGYWDKQQFLANFTWWKKRLAAFAPDYLLTDYAPTALLAAFSLGIARGACGTGFTLPPAALTTPSLHPWFHLAEKDLAQAEAIVAARIREAVPTLQTTADIFKGAQRYLTIFPETDHFEKRDNEKFWGPVFEDSSGTEFVWPENQEPKLFFYLSAANARLKEFLACAKAQGFPAVGYIRGLAESDRKRMSSNRFSIYPEPLNMAKAAAECNLAVLHGGYNTTVRLLLAGKRLLICPEQTEQNLLAHRLQSRGLCEAVSLFGKDNMLKPKLDQLFLSADLGAKSAAFAQKYKGYDANKTVKEIVRTCLHAIP